jgi:hypothetical protein
MWPWQLYVGAGHVRHSLQVQLEYDFTPRFAGFSKAF